MAPRLLSRNEAAAYCGVAVNTFTAHVEPHLPTFEIGRRRLWDVREIDAWIDRMAPLGHIPVTDDEWLNRG